MKDLRLEELIKMRDEIDDEIKSRKTLKDLFDDVIRKCGYNGYGDIMEQYIDYQGDRYYDFTYREIYDEFDSWDEDSQSTPYCFGGYICNKYEFKTQEQVDEYMNKIMQECVDCQSVGSKENY